jgi:two-component system sensor histidine kinase VanS
LKNDFYRLRRKIFLQIIVVLAITGIAGIIISKFIIDGVLQAPFADGFIAFCKKVLHLDDASALNIYQQVFRNNKELLLIIGFILLLLVFFYFALSRFNRYFIQISDSVDKILDETDQPISLTPDLEFMETKLNTIKTTLKKRKAAAIESEQRKNDLVVYLAHDIKTPLTSVIGYLSLLNEAPDMPLEQRAKYSSITLNKALRLEELINEFFDITRFNLQHIELEAGEINLSLMLEQMADEFYPLLAPKNIKTVVEAEEGLIIHGDANKLARVFNNILKNAASYSNENSTLAIKTVNQSNQTVNITFRNQGRRIPAHQLDTIFEKFYRLDSARASNTGGAGLGLAIAKEILQLHKGTISVQSNDEFTEFMITLPI